MLVLLAEYLSQLNSGFTVFQYITVRGIMGILTALIVSLVIGPTMIRRLNYHQIGQVVRTDGPESHFSKAGTPTMGGADSGQYCLQYIVVGWSAQCLCVGGHAGYPVFWCDRLGR